MNNMLNAAYLIEQIKNGKTLYVKTMTHITKITAKNLASWERSGYTLLKNNDKGDLLMANGKKFVCCNFCQITLQ